MDEDNIISSYSRAQSIDDGFLIDITDEAEEHGFVIPTAITSNLYHSYVEPAPDMDASEGQSVEGRLHDVLYLLYAAIKTSKDTQKSDHLEYTVAFRMPNGELQDVTIWAMVGPGDDEKPVLTIMLPEDY